MVHGKTPLWHHQGTGVSLVSAFCSLFSFVFFSTSFLSHGICMNFIRPPMIGGSICKPMPIYLSAVCQQPQIGCLPTKLKMPTAGHIIWAIIVKLSLGTRMLFLLLLLLSFDIARCGFICRAAETSHPMTAALLLLLTRMTDNCLVLHLCSFHSN